MDIVLLSSLPEFLSRFGLRHQFPLDPAADDDGSFSVRAGVYTRDRDGAVSFREMDDGGPRREDIAFSRIALRSDGTYTPRAVLTDGSRGPAAGEDFPLRDLHVAHLTGTSDRLKGLGGQLARRSIPIVYSPFLPEVPLGGMSWILSMFRRESRLEISAGREIASVARSVTAGNEIEARFLASIFGVPPERVRLIPPGSAPAARSSRLRRDLVVAFCDDISPRWNVLRFLQAMERLNCDALIVAPGNETSYCRKCLELAEGNPRVRIVPPDRRGEEIPGAFADAAVVVDPSLRGLGYPLMRAVRTAGRSAVISDRSKLKPFSDDGVFFFEPTSWELLHHAVTSALNAASSGQAASPSGGPPSNRDNDGIRRALARLYGEVIGG